MIFVVGMSAVACSPFEVSKSMTRKGRIESVTAPQARSQPGPGQIGFVQIARSFVGDRNQQAYEFRFQLQDGGSTLTGSTFLTPDTSDLVKMEDQGSRVAYSVESRCIDSGCGRIVFHVLRRSWGSTQIEKSLAAAFYSVSDGPASRFFEESNQRFNNLDEVIAAARQYEADFMTP
jgi:hypothetical protein